jgi:hypothetical protein
MNVYGESGRMDALILNLSTKWEWQFHPHYARNRRLREIQRWSGRRGEEKNLFSCRKTNRSSSVVQPVA